MTPPNLLKARRAHRALAWLFFGLAAAAPATGQAQTAAAPATSQPGPDTTLVHQLIWSAMAALDHANRTGNYSVLRDLGAPSFQERNSAATLGQIFERFRSQPIELGGTLTVNPVFSLPPTIDRGLLRVRGTFPMRPTAIEFDMLFQNIGGQWRIFGLAVRPLVPAGQPGR